MEKKDMKQNNQAGFTLVEIAIVMVIIGLLIGGVLKGQAMIENAKVKRVVKQADELRAAVMSFYDKFGVYPGDENKVPLPVNNEAGDGNGNGQINAAEQYELFDDLQESGLIGGSYAGNTTPNHAFGDNVSLYWLNPPGPGAARHYFLFYNLPAEACLEIDTKYDDGIYNSGSIVGNAAYTAGTNIGGLYIQF